MPRKPEWLQNVTSAIQELHAFPAPVVDRATLEKLLNVRRREAIRLMHRFGGYQTSRTFLVDRLELMNQLEAIQRGETHQAEMQRRQRLDASLKPRKTIPVTPDVWKLKLAELPQGTRFRPGLLEIEFQTADQLLGRLFELAQALHNDYEQFETLISHFVPISSPAGGKACT
jgi:hypothetical protein